MRALPTRAALVLGALLLGLALGEGLVRASGADRRAVNRALTYQTVDPQVHQPDPGPLQYGLKPGARADYDGRWGPYTVTVGARGERGAFPAARRSGSTRIAVVGGSTVYGAEVSDEQALPARLQAALRARGVDADVANLGVSAWVTRQMADRARQALAWDLDLVLLVHTNEGPRPFLLPEYLDDADFSPWFQAEPERWGEHIPGPLPANLHQAALQHLAGYRLVAARLRGEGDALRPLAAARAREAVLRLDAEAASADVPVLYLLWPEGWDGRPEDLPLELPPERVVDLDPLVQDDALRVEHPPPDGLAWYGERLADWLVEAGWVRPAP